MNEAPQKEKGPRTNDDIKAAKVLLIDEHGEKQGVMPLAAALDVDDPRAPTADDPRP